MSVYMYVCDYACLSVCLLLCLYPRLFVCLHMYMHVCLNTHIDVLVHMVACKHIPTYTRTHTHIHMHTYPHTHAHIPTYTRTQVCYKHALAHAAQCDVHLRCGYVKSLDTLVRGQCCNTLLPESSRARETQGGREGGRKSMREQEREETKTRQKATRMCVTLGILSDVSEGYDLGGFYSGGWDRRRREVLHDVQQGHCSTFVQKCCAACKQELDLQCQYTASVHANDVVASLKHRFVRGCGVPERQPKR